MRNKVAIPIFTISSLLFLKFINYLNSKGSLLGVISAFIFVIIFFFIKSIIEVNKLHYIKKTTIFMLKYSLCYFLLILFLFFINFYK